MRADVLEVMAEEIGGRPVAWSVDVEGSWWRNEKERNRRKANDFYWRHRLRVLAEQAAYYRRNAGHIKARVAVWYRKNRVAILARRRVRYAAGLKEKARRCKARPS